MAVPLERPPLPPVPAHCRERRQAAFLSEGAQTPYYRSLPKEATQCLAEVPGEPPPTSRRVAPSWSSPRRARGQFIDKQPRGYLFAVTPRTSWLSPGLPAGWAGGDRVASPCCLLGSLGRTSAPGPFPATPAKPPRPGGWVPACACLTALIIKLYVLIVTPTYGKYAFCKCYRKCIFNNSRPFKV